MSGKVARGGNLEMLILMIGPTEKAKYDAAYEIAIMVCPDELQYLYYMAIACYEDYYTTEEWEEIDCAILECHANPDITEWVLLSALNYHGIYPV